MSEGEEEYGQTCLSLRFGFGSTPLTQDVLGVTRYSYLCYIRGRKTSNMSRHGTLNPYERKYRYFRAVRKGPFIFVSGTTSIDPTSGNVLHHDSAYDQALRIFSEIIVAIEALGGRKEDVVRLRIFVKESGDGDVVGNAMKDVFGDIAPAATMVFGVGFVDPSMKVEIEADAVVLEG